MADLVNFRVNNSFPNLECLHQHLDTLDLLHPEHLRPNWDTYFMVRPTSSSVLEFAEVAEVTHNFGRLWHLLHLADPIA